MPSHETGFPSPGAGTACGLLGPHTQKHVLPIEGPVETLQPSLLALALALPPRKGQAASSPIPDPVPGPSWLPGWLQALAFTPKGATRKQEMLPNALPALGAVASPQAGGHIQAAVLTGLSNCWGGEAHRLLNSLGLSGKGCWARSSKPPPSSSTTCGPALLCLELRPSSSTCAGTLTLRPSAPSPQRQSEGSPQVPENGLGQH